MLKKYILIVFLGGLFLLGACQKEEIPTYSDVERINFDLREMELKKDSVEIALGFFKGDVKEFPLSFYVIGYPKDYARKINVEVTSKDSAWADVTYSLPEVMEMPANELTCSITLSILRDPALEKKAKSFTVTLGASEGLEPGLYTSLYVKVTDGIPTKWIGDDMWSYGPKLEDFFGVCSRTKYQFVYDQLGMYDFSAWTSYGIMGDATKLNAAKSFLKKQLAAYEAEHGQLVDKDKGKVTFPD